MYWLGKAVKQLGSWEEMVIMIWIGWEDGIGVQAGLRDNESGRWSRNCRGGQFGEKDLCTVCVSHSGQGKELLILRRLKEEGRGGACMKSAC